MAYIGPQQPLSTTLLSFQVNRKAKKQKAQKERGEKLIFASPFFGVGRRRRTPKYELREGLYLFCVGGKKKITKHTHPNTHTKNTQNLNRPLSDPTNYTHHRSTYNRSTTVL